MSAPLIDISSTGVTRTRVRPTKTEGVPGVAFYGGFIQREERNRKLVGPDRYKTFSDIIANTAIVAAGVRYYLNLMAKAAWSVEPAEMEGVRRQSVADEMADMMNEIINEMRRPWHRVVRRSAMYRFYGFNVQEWTAKRREDGSIGYLDIAPRPQHTIERWDLEEDGNVLGVVQRAPNDGRQIYLPRNKLVYLVEDSISDNPEGLGLLRHMVDANDRLKDFETLEHYGFETDLRGIPIVKGPFAALEDEVRGGRLTAADRDKMVEPLKKFVLNHIKSPTRGLMMDSEPYRDEGDKQTPSSVAQWTFEVAQGGAQGQAEVASAIERLNREIARIMGVEGLLLGGEKVGSQALSADKSHTFGLIVDSGLREMREQFNDDVIGPIWRMNGWDEELKPTFKTDQVQYRDINQITTALVDMGNAGSPIDPDWEGINVLMDLLGLPKVDLEARAIDAALLTPEPPEPPQPPGTPDPDPEETDDEEVDDEGDE